MEWPNDGGMSWFLELRVLPWFENLPSLHLIRSFHHHSWMKKLLGMKIKWLKWLMNDISSIVIFIVSHSRHSKMMEEWPNEEEWSCFLRGRKNMTSQIPVILPSFHHSNFIPFWSELISPKKIEMSLNGWEWGQNDLIRCCLLLGDSTGLNHSNPIPQHSSVIPVILELLSQN